MNHPESGNATLAEALGAAVTDLHDDSAVRVVVLTGAGARFCVGGDVRAFGTSDSAPDAIDAITSRLHPAIESLAAMRKAS